MSKHFLPTSTNQIFQILFDLSTQKNIYVRVVLPSLQPVRWYKPIEACLMSNNIMDYHIVSQGKTTIPNVDDGEEFGLTDVRHRLMHLFPTPFSFSLACFWFEFGCPPIHVCPITTPEFDFHYETTDIYINEFESNQWHWIETNCHLPHAVEMIFRFRF